MMPMLKNVRIIHFFILSVLLLPLFWLNVIDYHDWGGDFSQYIQQAINIAEGLPNSHSYYIPNPYYPIAPKTYNVGFPLFLVPVYALCGNQISAFSFLITIFLFGSLILTFCLLSSRFGAIPSLLATIIVAYNPWILNFKGQILADLPFTFFFLLSILYYENGFRKNPGFIQALLLGLIMGITILIKNIGIVIFFSVLADFLIGRITWTSHKGVNPGPKSYTVALLSGIIIYVLFSKIIFPGEETFSFYSRLIPFGDLNEIILLNVDHYNLVLTSFFTADQVHTEIALEIIQALLCATLIIGLTKKALRKITFKEWVFLFYVIIIIGFPYISQGFRYVLPVLPLILYYLMNGLNWIWKEKKVAGLFSFGVIILSFSYMYQPGVSEILQREILYNSPQSPASKMAFHYLKNNTSENATLVFRKPRVIGLYTERNAYSLSWDEDLKKIERQLNELTYDYLVLCEDLNDPPLSKYIDSHSSELNLVYENAEFQVFMKEANGSVHQSNSSSSRKSMN